MTTKINLTYCGMDGSGATVKEAKQDAARKIEAVLDGSYTPFMIRHAGLVGIVWREPAGHCYKIIHDENTSGFFRGFSSGFGDTMEKARAQLAHHMGQITGVSEGLETYLDASQMRQLAEYNAWQDRFRAAKQAGYDDDACRQIADQRTTCV